jgi:SAM-dependent methyltransferase
MAQPVNRRPFQGVWTIIRFNWHFHAIALAAIALLWVAAVNLSGWAALVCALSAVSAAFTVLISLLATWHAYDASGLYQLGWLAPELDHARHVANIHAGFDETSVLLESAFPNIIWHIFDFYNPTKHTEISIRRARKAQAPSPDTLAIHTDHIPLADASLDRALMMLAAHEIRDHNERVAFFREVKRVLTPRGRIVVTEHLRDFANIAAFSIGAWHFHPREEWLATFQKAGFRLAREFRNNLLITTFVLEPDADTP